MRNASDCATGYTETATRKGVIAVTTMQVTIIEESEGRGEQTTVMIKELSTGKFTVNGRTTEDVWGELLHHRNLLILSLAGNSMECSGETDGG